MSGLELASVSSLYERSIHDTGREPELLFLVSFLLTFAFIRLSTHMIRAQVSWWPGNVEMGGKHIHHLVWGILLLVVSGYLGAVAGISEQPWRYILVVLFGVGAGLTFDEFALWLNLRDVYWEKEGRSSIDAVIVVALLALIGVTGFGAWVETADEIANGVFAALASLGLIGVALALAAAAKGRFWLAAGGVLVPPAAAVGAIRLAKPTSLWARRFYDADKIERARRRYGAPGGATA